MPKALIVEKNVALVDNKVYQIVFKPIKTPAHKLSRASGTKRIVKRQASAFAML